MPAPALASVRILLVADTHIGFDDPLRPRIERRRRGPDFLANFERALAPAREGQADLVVHGGDLLFRSKVPAPLVQRAMEPLFRVADGGVPVFLVPGNHERSRIPYPLLASHPQVHVFHEPDTAVVDVGATRIALSGFPFDRRVGDRFPELLERTGWKGSEAHLRVLCIHQAVEGAQVEGFTFRRGADVLPGRDIPAGFAAVLSGHIHRAQVLRHDLAGEALAAPVVYPGSVERTAFAEMREEKGCFLLTLTPGGQPGGSATDIQWIPLPARPMIEVTLGVDGLSEKRLRERVAQNLAVLDPDAVVRLRVEGALAPGSETALRAEALRALAPATMNVTVVFPRPRTP